MRDAIFAVAVVAALLQPTPKPQSPVDAVVAPVVVPLELLGGRPVVAIKVNGAGPFRFLIDPSAPTGHVDVGLIEELRLRPPDRRATKAASNSADSRFVGIEIGNIAVPDVEMRPVDMTSIVPEFGPSTRPRGILGKAAWNGRLLTIDYPSWRVALAPGTLPAPNGQDIFTLDTHSPDLALTVTVGGTQIRCEMDLLSTSGLLLPESYVQALPLVKPPVVAGSTRTRAGVVAVRDAQLADNALLGPAVFVRPVIQFSPQVPVPIVGTAWLGDFALIFDLTNGRVRFVHRRA